MVTYGDVPLLSAELLGQLVTEHESQANAVTVLTTQLDDAAGYGRILREGDQVVGIVEQKDATDEQLAITEINSGIYAFDAATLTEALATVSTDNAQGEKYLTDVLGLARSQGRSVSALVTEDRWQVEGANDRVQLQGLAAELNRRTVTAHMRAGTTVIDPATTWIDASVTLEEDTTILPGTQLHGLHPCGPRCCGGPRLHADRCDCRRGRRGAAHPRHWGTHRTRRRRRALHLPARRHRLGRRRQDRSVLRDQERHRGPRLQALPPRIRRRRHDRGEHQHRVRQHHRQLRRRGQTPHGDRFACANQLKHSVRGTGGRRRRRLHRCWGSGAQERAAGCFGTLSRAAAQRRRVG